MPILRGDAKSGPTILHPIFIDKKLRESAKKCPIELKSWKINCAPHFYPDSSPITVPLIE